MAEKKLFIIDLMPFLYKGHFVFLRSPRITSNGINVSALLGFANGITSILGEHKPSHAVLAMDPQGPTFRHQAYPPYKAQREKMPEDLAANIPYAFELADALNLPVISRDGFEADDVMGSLAKKAAADGFEVFLATPDKDAAQLVDEHIHLFRPGHGKDPAEIYDAERVKEHWSLSSPAQMIDYLALAGDAADNIPGVKGVGEKTAKSLLAQYGSVEEIIAHAGEIPGKLGEKIAAATEDARMSKFLTTIRTDVPLDIDWNDLERREPDPEKFPAVCRKYELTALARKLGCPITAAPPASGGAPAAAGEHAFKTLADVAHDYRLIADEAAARALVRELEAAGRIAFDTETTGTDAHTADLVGMSFATAPGKAWYVTVPPHGAAAKAQTSSGGDLFAFASANAAASPAARERAEAFVRIFAPVFADPSRILVAHNAKFDITMLERYGIVFAGTVRDTMLEHYVTDAAARHGMDTLAREFLDYAPIPIEALIGEKERGKEQRSMAELSGDQICDYAAEDADVTLRLDDVLRPRATEAGTLAALEQSEEPLVRVLIGMEREGVRIDTAALARYGVELQAELNRLTSDITAVAGSDINLDSPKQLAEFLYGKLALSPAGAKKNLNGQYSTDEKTLRRIAGEHPVVEKILEYRACSKLKNTYVDRLPECIDPRDGRVHTTFSQSFAETGRLSSSDPNLQNIPVRTDRGRPIRAAIVPRDENHLLVSADYSQIELRIMAAMSGDESMLAAFASGADIHRETAARVYGVMAPLVTDEMRSRCKMVNFGIIYGISAFGLSERLHIPRKEAATLIESYFALYPRIKAFMESSIAKARATGYAVTALGRRRTLRDIDSRNATARQAAERDAVNTPVQGTAADLIKLAMVRVDRALREAKLKAKMVLQIHDELLFDVPRDEVEQVTEIARREMEGAMALGVPLEVAVGAGSNWLEAH